MNSEVPEIFKALLEHPFTLPSFNNGDTEKEKLGLGDNAQLLGGVNGMGPSAALTPAIWDKTIPYDGETFHLEYMDLEEFLIENGIPAGSDELSTKVTKPVSASPVGLLSIQELDGCETEVIIKKELEIICEVTTDVNTDSNPATPEPVDPEEIKVSVSYEPDPTDLVLSSVPGGELFDPRKHKFTEDELKPQPMIKKAKKVFVPEEQKDEKYWQRRKKNNVAAKRSRDARRLKENQITVRAAFLERENVALRVEVAELRKECSRFKNVVGHYEAKFGSL
ncbi:TEF transcription factor, PAR bZIP family member a isoform X2 [Cynoglossus semilaevis]|uniref:TEF transcription factor, PAR bZIP family member a n=1 Tax=Cynoglossus semilaevis TaxID=244447 RepID=A0A3P8X4D7_CYNSE|nr:thyrotroph embryonic factor-like isoform X2 [Cynoglossus semilaevis]